MERDCSDRAPARAGDDVSVVDITVGLDPTGTADEVTSPGPSPHGRLPVDGQSLWWPDRNAQVVQATRVTPHEAAGFLRSASSQLDDRLRVDSVTERSQGQFEIQARLHVRRTGWRKVMLRIYPTPSGNLSVIEMLPRRAWMPQTERYLAAGVPAITSLTDLIEAANSSQS